MCKTANVANCQFSPLFHIGGDNLNCSVRYSELCFFLKKKKREKEKEMDMDMGVLYINDGLTICTGLLFPIACIYK